MLFLYRKNPCPIKQYVLYGERHSGTKFLDQLIRSVFGLHRNEYYGHKHFFGFVDNKMIEDDKSTLFLAITRSPYHWISGMNNVPHHVPSHLCPIYSHLLDEWYSIDQYYRVFDKRSYTINKKTREILEDRNFITQQRYKNIFDMRSTKLDYLINQLPLYANNYVLVSYESLLNNRDTYLNTLSNNFKLKINQQAVDNNRVYPATRREIPTDVKDIITHNLNWKLEKQIGYNISLASN